MEEIKLQRIKSFEVDHTKLDKGLYISRVDGDIITYDLRMVKPNTPPFLENSGIHTFEHLLAGPMGCRTGFYLLFKDLAPKSVITIVQNALEFISRYHGEIPGCTKLECGNYLDHDLSKAKNYAEDMLKVLDNWKCENLQYSV